MTLKPYPNALRSTGPRTPDGKAISSRNSLTHGLTAKRVVIPGEDQAEFDALLAGLTEDRQPEGELELQLTAEVGACIWRLARARDHEAKILEVTYGLYDRGVGKLDLVMRYIASIERQMQRAIARLDHCQDRRRKLACAQFVSQPAENKPESPAAVEAPEFVSQPAEDQPEPAPLVMVAGSSLPDEPSEWPAPAEAPESVSQVVDISSLSFDPFAHLAPHLAELEAAVEREVRKGRR